MKCIRMEAKTDRAHEQIRLYGEFWKVIDERPRVDRSYFKTKHPQFYIIPWEPPTPRNCGAKWINAFNDPDYNHVEVVPPKIRRPR